MCLKSLPTYVQAAYKGVLAKASEVGNVVRLQTAGAKRAHQEEDDFEVSTAWTGLQEGTYKRS